MDAADTADRPRHFIASREGLAMLLACGVLLALAWPDRPVHYPDSREYLDWPAPISPGKGVGARIFGYPLVLRALGHGSGLMALQATAWLAGFAGLGFALARVPGVLLLGVIGLAPAIAWWNAAVLTESLTLSLGAALLALGVRAARRPLGLPLVVLWCLLCVAFGSLRPGNLLALPFLVVPFVRQPRPQLAAVCGVALLVFAVGFVQTQRSALWRINYYTAFVSRVLPDPTARAHFESQGMPAAGLMDRDAFLDWFHANAGSDYPRWIATRPASWSDAWTWLVKPGESRDLRQKYFARQESMAGAITPVATLLFDLSALPRWLWLAIVVLAPALDWRRRGSPSVLSLYAVALALGSYGQTFVVYNGSGSGHLRHLLLASLLYRATWMVALCSIFQTLRGDAEPGDATRLDDSRPIEEPTPT